MLHKVAPLELPLTGAANSDVDLFMSPTDEVARELSLVRR